MKPIERQRPNWIEIDLDALRHNITELKQLHPNSKYLLPVKADAYGHGILACSFAAIQAGVDYLGVAHLFEGIPLRQYGCRAPILILGPLLEEDFEQVFHHQLIPTLVDFDTAQLFNEWLLQRGLRWKAHIKVDTGMSRYGIAWDDQTIVKIFELSQIDIEGIFTHIACAEDLCATSNEVQLERFHSTLEGLPRIPELVHFANSASSFQLRSKYQTMIRPGLASYGYNPLYPEKSPLELKPVLSLYSTIRQIKTIPAGEGISYGHRFKTPIAMPVVAVAIGYGDGLFRTQQDQNYFVINDISCPVLGTVCMDTCLVDISQLKVLPKIGDMVRVIDGCYDSLISMEEVASRANTIPYELTCRMARRLYRIYRYKNEEYRWDELRGKLGIHDPIFSLGF